MRHNLGVGSYVEIDVLGVARFAPEVVADTTDDSERIGIVREQRPELADKLLCLAVRSVRDR